MLHVWEMRESIFASADEKVDEAVQMVVE